MQASCAAFLNRGRLYRQGLTVNTNIGGPLVFGEIFFLNYIISRTGLHAVVFIQKSHPNRDGFLNVLRNN